MDSTGLLIGPPLENFHGILTGVPTWVGPDGTLQKKAPNVS